MQILHKAGAGGVGFRPEDPNSNVEYKDLDRSNIPATPDCLVTDGVGLQIFLRHANTLDGRLPTQAIGETPGPAIMSYGAALAMFGTQDELRTAAPIDQEPDEMEQRAEGPIEECIERCALVEEPRTESEYRLQDKSQPQSKPILSSEDQWALFKKGKLMADVGILARHYTKLVTEKAQAAKEEMFKPSGVHLAAASTPLNIASERDGWPPVEELDWAGFTNWVYNCKKVDAKFTTVTMKKWNAERAERRTNIAAKLKAWKPPADFDDGSSNDPDPRTFYHGERSIGELDFQKSDKKQAAARKNPPTRR